MAKIHMPQRGRKRSHRQAALRALVAVTFCLVVAANASEPSVEICLTDFPPYQGEELLGGGAMVQLATEAFRRGGYRAQVHFMPWARVLQQGSAGKCAILGIWRSATRDQMFEYSLPLVRHELGFFGRKSVNRRDAGADELSGLRIGVERGTYLSPGLLAPDIFLEPASSMRLNLFKLEKGRVDLIFGDRIAGQFVIDSEPALKLALEWKYPGLEPKNDYLAITKIADQKDAVLAAFNLGLQSMMADGHYGSVLKAAGLQAAR